MQKENGAACRGVRAPANVAWARGSQASLASMVPTRGCSKKFGTVSSVLVRPLLQSKECGKLSVQEGDVVQGCGPKHAAQLAPPAPPLRLARPLPLQAVDLLAQRLHLCQQRCQQRALLLCLLRASCISGVAAAQGAHAGRAGCQGGSRS